MRVDAAVRRAAILRCMRELHILPGRGLYLKTLQTQWPDKGLRGEDLLDGLEEMAREGLLTVEHDSDESDLFVTLGVGIQDADRITWKASLDAASVVGALRKARKRERPGYVPNTTRRAAEL